MEDFTVEFLFVSLVKNISVIPHQSCGTVISLALLMYPKWAPWSTSGEVLLGDTISVNFSVLDAAIKTFSKQDLLRDFSFAKD